ncbi:MAG: hypothetical protein KatS3mg019_1968 [Fimbriimonadales bacterium]|nr:MAG: hypothetical protein KatS3mg019_1968 [Fimbriimonadales bacterium]
MGTISVSVEDLNRRYAYCSGIAPDEISYLSQQGILHMPFYRWDPERLEVEQHSATKRSHKFPLVREIVEFRAVSEYTLALDEVVTKCCLFYRLKYLERKGIVYFSTDFPLPVKLRLDRWDVVIYPSKRIIGKYIEHITWLLIGEGVSYEFLLESPLT